MTTTAFDDQFTTAPEHVTHQPYDVTAILRQNVADLEMELRRQRERADKAEAALKAAREQEPVAYVKYKATGGNVGLSWIAIPTDAFYPRDGEALYARPIPAPAPAVQCSDCGMAWDDQQKHACICVAEMLRQDVPAPAVSWEWREVMAELAADLQAYIDAEHAYRDQYSSVMRKYQNDMRIVERARALLQSGGGK